MLEGQLALEDERVRAALDDGQLAAEHFEPRSREAVVEARLELDPDRPSPRTHSTSRTRRCSGCPPLGSTTKQSVRVIAPVAVSKVVSRTFVPGR
jgi:hypothetical protein